MQRSCGPRIQIPAPSYGTDAMVSMVGSRDIRCQDEAARNAIKTITGRILRSDDLLFLVEEGGNRTYMLANAIHLRAYEGKSESRVLSNLRTSLWYEQLTRLS